MLSQFGVHAPTGVLEIGCGALHLAKPLLLAFPNVVYIGIDPNEWLRNAAREHDPQLDAACTSGRVIFSRATDFRAGHASVEHRVLALGADALQ